MNKFGPIIDTTSQQLQPLTMMADVITQQQQQQQQEQQQQQDAGGCPHRFHTEDFRTITCADCGKTFICVTPPDGPRPETPNPEPTTSLDGDKKKSKKGRKKKKPRGSRPKKVPGKFLSFMGRLMAGVTMVGAVAGFVVLSVACSPLALVPCAGVLLVGGIILWDALC